MSDLDDEELEATRKLYGVGSDNKGSITPQKADRTKMEKKEKENKIKELKAELVKQEYQANLKEHMEQRLYDLMYKLNHIDSSLSIVELKSWISQKNVVGLSPKYNNTELAILFDYYKQFIERINQVKQYIPSQKDFCSFVGISSTQYNNWRQSDDSERREIMQIIDDYITDLMLTASQNGDIKEISTIYRTKSEHGMIEASAPIVIKHKSETNISEIMKQIEAVNQGKSLKTIELKKNQNDIYEEVK